MKNILEECIEKIQKNHRSIRRYTMVFVVLAILVFAGVNWKLHQQGISMTADYQCGMEEHHHTEACYKKVLICEKEETDGSEGHHHTETCYEQRNNLICQITEHIHGEECYDENGNLLCGQEEHVHDQSCYRMENVLICGQEESAPVEAHHHTEVCYESQLTCQITEHTHSVECMIDESADVETASDWEATIPGNLSGKWAEDLVAVAKSQLGYQESTANFRLAEDGQTHKGYTRYGAWYGNPYGDWCAMFASFCLHYAQIPESSVPVNSGAAAWIPQLQNVGIYDTPDNYSPQSGDLVFFDTDANGSADHVGIVESVTDSHMTVIEGNSSDMVKENTYSLDDGTVVGYGKLPENPETVEEDNYSLKRVSRVMAREISENVTGFDLGTYVTKLSLMKKVGSVWENADSFTTGDDIKAEIVFNNIPVNTIQDSDYKAHIALPEQIDCSKFQDTYDLYDGNTKSGTYTYQQAEDGTWYIVIIFEKQYVDEAEADISGKLDLKFRWNDNAISEEGETTKVVIGNQTSEVTVTKDPNQGGESTTTGSNYSLSKSSGDLGYNEDGTAYLEYTVTLDVKNETTGPLTLHDILYSTNFDIDGEPTISDSAYNVKFENKNAETNNQVEADLVIGSVDQTISVGKYTIQYKVKTKNTANITSDSVHNSITLQDTEGNTYSADDYKTISSSTITKGGVAVSENGTTYIDWSIYLNSGSYVQNITTPVKFEDTIPEGLKLNGSSEVVVEKYDPDGRLIESTSASVTDNKIEYTTDTGRFYYKITYRTEIIDSLPIGNTTFSNTGNVTGGMNGDATGTVTIGNHILTKKCTNHVIKQENGNWVVVISWTSLIDSENLSGYVYTDWAGQSNTTMTETQRNAIQIVGGDGQAVDPDKYTISDCSEKQNGLFKVQFTNDCANIGPVTISYETTTDLTDVTVGSFPAYNNYAKIEDTDGNSDDTSATRQIYYTQGDWRKILKYNTNYDSSGQGSMTLDPGSHTIPWVILLNDMNGITESPLKGDLTVIDTIPKGLILVEDSISLGIPFTKEVIHNSDGTTTLTVNIRKEDYSRNIELKYNTEIDPESEFLKGNAESATYTNTASVTDDNGTESSTRTETVTRKIVNKTGSYDGKNRLLTYNIVVNPDGSQLLGENAKLEITDKITARDDTIQQYVELTSLKLFTAYKSTDSTGKTSVTPGKYICDLTRNNDSEELYTYTYDSATDQFVGYIPDGNAYVLVATYFVNANLAQNVGMINSVSISGNDNEKWSSEDSSTQALQSTEGSTWTGYHVTVVKHDSTDYNKKLPGAVFALYKYVNSNWEQVDTLTTDTDGTDSGTVIADTLYKLVEMKQPEDYLLDATPYYFMLLANGSDSNVILPNSIESEDSYSIDKVNITKVAENDQTLNVVIDRYNEADKTVVKSGQIRVNKVWKDSNGELVTEESELNTMPEVKMTLTKHTTTSGHTVTLVAGTYSGAPSKTIDNLKNGCYITIQFSDWGIYDFENQILCSDPNVTINTQKSGTGPYYYTIKLGPINNNCTITNADLYWKDTVCTSEGGSESSVTKDTTIASALLSPANNWTYLWSNLEMGDGITYSVTEEAVSGYVTSYTLNTGEATDQVIVITPGTNGDTITVTNTAESQTEDSGYELPKTGGSGTVLFTLGGVLLMGAAMWYEYILKCRRERRRR